MLLNQSVNTLINLLVDASSKTIHRSNSHSVSLSVAQLFNQSTESHIFNRFTYEPISHHQSYQSVHSIMYACNISASTRFSLQSLRF